LASTVLLGQIIPVGSVNGTVFDSTGAVVPQAKIVVSNTETGEKREIESDGQGRYFASQLPPGNYRVEADKAGFQKAAVEIRIETGRKLTLDLDLAVGTSTSSVQVRSEAPLVEAGSASIGALVNNRMVLELPLAGRNPLRLAYLSPGIATSYAPGASTVTDVSGTSYIATAGSNQRQNEFYIDGVPNTIQDRVLYIPTADAVQEFNLQTNPLDAEYGHGGGFYANLTTKSGTNDLHGTLFEFFQNDKLNANSYFNNRSGAKKAASRLNQFGTTVGGPIIKDKTFWFFMYEGVRQRNPTSSINTVPTADQAKGDFSTTYPVSGKLVGIYDPVSSTYDATTNKWTRTAFGNNLIPASRIDKVAANLAKMWPAANLPTDATGINNYLFTGSGSVRTDAYVTRIDHTLAGKHKLFGRFSTTKTLTISPWVVNLGSVGGSGPTSGNNRVQTSIGVGDTFVLTPRTIITVRAGYARWTQEGLTPIYDLSSIGWPSSLIRSFQEQILPTISISNYVGAGNEGNWFEHTNTFSFDATVNQVMSRHNLKYGLQLQPKRNNYQLAQRPSGTFSFTPAMTAGPDPNATGTTIGQSFASFLLGAAASGSANIRAAYSFQGNYYGAFIQDDIKVTPKLTLNVGLRYELQPNVTERYNRSVRGFDTTTTNPIEAAAKANYALSPVAALSVNDFRVVGGQVFATPDARGNGGLVEKKMFVPRVGLAYRVNDKTVLRAGFGMFRSFWWQVSSTTEGTGAETTTTMVNSVDGIRPTNYLSNPFPDGLVQPTTNSGLSTLVGSSISPFYFYKKFPYNKRWSFGIQREFARDFGIEVNYVGNGGIHVPVGTGGGEQNRQIHYLPAKYLSLGSQLNTAVANPFYGVITIPGTLSQKSISLSNLLMTYPHFTSVSLLRETNGTSIYHSLQSSLTKRYSAGVQLGFTFTWSKQMENVRYSDVTDAGPAHTIGEYDRPKRITFNMVWDLPIGAGKKVPVKNAVADKFIGGWQVSTMSIFQSGAAINLSTNMLPTGTSPHLDRSEQTVDRWYNTAAFSAFPSYTVRTLPYFLSSLRNDGVVNWDISVLKNIRVIRERVRTQFRFEMFNALNRAQFANPTINPTSSSNGKITSQANSPRLIQLGLKLIF
jgi:hypothetical protein